MLATKLVLGIGQGQGTPKLSRSYSVDPSPFTSATSKSRGLLRDAVLTHNIQTSASKEGKDKLDKPSTRPSSVSSINDDVSEDEVDYAFIDSNKFLYGVFLACLVVQVSCNCYLNNKYELETCQLFSGLASPLVNETTPNPSAVLWD